MEPSSTTYWQPAEWEPHEACWLAWPAAADLWLDNLTPAQKSFVGLARAIADVDTQGNARGERLEILVTDDNAAEEARDALAGVPARFHAIAYGDIWLRDTAPIFLRDSGGVRAARFGFNGWGGKYVLPDDDMVAERIAVASGLPT